MKIFSKIFSKTYCYHYNISFHRPDRTFSYDGTLNTNKRIIASSYLQMISALEEKYKVEDLVNANMSVNSLTLL